MAHGNGEHMYRRLGHKIDSLQTRAPWNEAFCKLLKTLFTPEEAEVVIKMPYGLSTLDRIAQVTGYERTWLQKTLESLCSQGLVVDLWVQGEYRYMPAPLVIGIFELVMMRTGNGLNSKKWAELLHEYMHGDDGFYPANFAHGERVSVMRTLPHEEVILPSEYVEVLDYEKATAIIENTNRFAMGLCSCRHEKMHLGQKECDVPLDLCSSFGPVADSAIRHGFAKEVSKSEMRENLARAKELKLTLAADNVKTRVGFICYCCKCCCNLLLGVSKHGFPNAVMTSNFLAQVHPEKCKGCGKCADGCPVDAIKLMPRENPESEAKKIPRIQADLCLGCGVCGLTCPLGAMALVKRKQRMIQPETTFERVILQCLERGTLQNQLFDNPQSLSQKFMRGFVGGFLRLPPVKKALMSDALRSSFLASMRKGTEKQGKGWLLEI